MRILALAAIAATLAAPGGQTTPDVRQQTSRQALDQRRLEEAVAGLESWLAGATGFRAQLVVTEYPQGR